MIGYKNIGETTHEYVLRYRRENNIPTNIKVGICGKLDPQAKGKMKILVGSDTKLMKQYMNSSKIYEFDIMIGISTRSDDVMGKVNDSRLNITDKDIKLIKNYMTKELIKITQQKFHHISAYKIRKRPGPKRPLWYWFKEGILVDEDIPYKNVNVFNITYLDSNRINYIDYLNEVSVKLNSMTNKETWDISNIMTTWNNISLGHKLIKLSYRIHVSSGFYIRMIAKNINSLFNIPVHISNINRIDIIDNIIK